MNRKILLFALSGLLLLSGCQTASASGDQSAGSGRTGESAIVVEYEKTENPSWAKLMYLKDGAIETCTLDKAQTLEDLGTMQLTGDLVKAVSAGKDGSALEIVESPSWESAAFRPMTNEEKELLSPIFVPHQYLYHSLGKTASFLPEEELTDQQFRIYMNLAAVQLEQNPDWLAPVETADDIRQYDGKEFLKLAQSCYPGLPDNALEQLPAPDTKEDDLGRVFLWYDSQAGRVLAAPAELGGMLPAPMVKVVRREGNSLEFILIDRAGPVCEKTFACEKSDQGYAVKKVEIKELG